MSAPLRYLAPDGAYDDFDPPLTDDRPDAADLADDGWDPGQRSTVAASGGMVADAYRAAVAEVAAMRSRP